MNSSHCACERDKGTDFREGGGYNLGELRMISRNEIQVSFHSSPTITITDWQLGLGAPERERWRLFSYFSKIGDCVIIGICTMLLYFMVGME